MNIKKFFAVIILSLVVLSCEKEEQVTLEEREIPYNILERGSFPVAEDNTINEQYLVFKNKEEWSSFLSLMNFKSPEKAGYFREINFDFDTKTLLIITAEFDYSCCKKITITEVYRDQGRIFVKYEIDASNGSAQTTCQSYVLFEVSKS